MEPLYIIAIGVMAGTAAYLLMSRNVLRMVLGLLLFGNAANLTLFVAGRLGSSLPPLIPGDQTTLAISANPLPQALVLTAIVISFSLVVFTVVLLRKAHERLHIVDTEEMREAEPVNQSTDDDLSGAKE
ncbi:putative monovalent cation/H+ antiporter subunit C [Pusillimonas sp. T7-7]|uniref:NADH-quinone oxidoreductase subunit K n=1 Tax=Pusillimonas sp. (strain T7-7) TaxID=1007105 RepID=UPI0002085809|nr:NADH-quinone oxidoreductase subunit K [Pusillimonas sp. T7-7]AEC19764.1 putative monovalent cation/H+ antiporter subunit C [Pusillimonas sp. T7-7]